MVTALFIKETLASAANDAEMVIEESRRMAVEYQERLEVGATCWDVDDVRPTPDKPEVESMRGTCELKKPVKDDNTLCKNGGFGGVLSISLPGTLSFGGQ